MRGRIYGKLRGATRPVAVGDNVEFRPTGPGEGAIEKIGPRRTKLSRPGIEKLGKEQVIATNVDLAIVVAAMSKPVFTPGLVDRILIASRAGGLDSLLCINKCDDGERGSIDECVEAYREIGIEVLFTSAVRGDGIDTLRDRMTDVTSVLSGQSGVGKSSLINAVQPGMQLKVAEIGEKTGKGRHTTTSVSLLPLNVGGFVVDTPGVREFGLWDVNAEDFHGFFPEIIELADSCRFANCSHTHEPGCAVKDAVERGDIREVRYESYTRILETL